MPPDIGGSGGRGAKRALLSVFQKWMLRYPLLATIAYVRNRDFQLEAWAYFQGLSRARDKSDSSIRLPFTMRTTSERCCRASVCCETFGVWGSMPKSSIFGVPRSILEDS